MISNSTQVPAFFVSNLYTNNLVLPLHIKYIGNPNGTIIVLFNNEQGTELPQSEYNLLESILKACNILITDILLINIHKQTLSIKDLKQQFNASKILIFGADIPNILYLNEFKNLYQMISIANLDILLSNSLAHLNMDANSKEILFEKKQLWALLKKIFAK